MALLALRPWLSGPLALALACAAVAGTAGAQKPGQATAGAPAQQAPPSSPAVGDVAPDFALPGDLPYPELASLSFEARQKLERIRPATLAQAARIPGVSPSDLQNLVMEVRKRRSAEVLAGGV